MRSEGDEPHIEGDAQEDDGQRHSQDTEPAHSHRTLPGVAPGGPAHLVKLKLVHAALSQSYQCGPLSLVEVQRGSSLIGRELHSVAPPVSLMP